MSKKNRFIEYFIVDILIAVHKIEMYLKKCKSKDEFELNFMCHDAVIRELEIIGEAMKHVLSDQNIKNIVNNEWRIIVDFRNVISHEYFGIDIDEIWNIVTIDLQNLKLEMKTFISNLPINNKNEMLVVLENRMKDYSKQYYICHFLEKQYENIKESKE